MIRHRPRIIYWQAQRPLTLSTTHFPTDGGVATDVARVALNVFDNTPAGVDVSVVANAVTPSVPDSAVGAESITAAPVLSPLVDSAAGNDVVQINDGTLHGTIQPPWRMIKSRARMLMWHAGSIVNFKLPDAASGIDSPSIAAQITPASDAGFGVDAVQTVAQTLLTVIDGGGFGQDTLLPISATAQPRDAASVNETIGVIASLSMSDAGLAVDNAVVVTTSFLVGVVDAMLGDDSASPSIAVQLGIPDAAQAMEIAGQFARNVVVLDTGFLFDSFHIPEAPQQIFSSDRWWVIQAQKRTWMLK